MGKNRGIGPAILKEVNVYRRMFIICTCAVVAVWVGCSGDDSGTGANPVVSVSLAPNEMDVEVGRAASITPTVTGGDNRDLTWFVNDIENGNDVFGMISHSSPVTYTAPDTLPDLVTVEVRAVSVADTTKYDSCLVTITFKVIHANIVSGNDTTGTGYVHAPVKTITRGMELASEGGTVLVAPGIYDPDHGETFPIYPKAGVAIVGEDWEDCIIRGGSMWGYAVSLGTAGSAVRKFTFESIPELGEDRWEHYVYMRGEDVLVDSLRTFQRTYYAPIRIGDATNAIVTTMGTTFRKAPMIPGISISGRNAAMVVAVALRTGAVTSRIPSMTARLTDFPICMCR